MRCVIIRTKKNQIIFYLSASIYTVGKVLRKYQQLNKNNAKALGNDTITQTVFKLFDISPHRLTQIKNTTQAKQLRKSNNFFWISNDTCYCVSMFGIVCNFVIVQYDHIIRIHNRRACLKLRLNFAVHR